MRLYSGNGDGEGYPSGLTASRLRFRRIHSFFKHHRLFDLARELEKATGVFFDAPHMEHLLQMGLWETAKDYLLHFLPNASYWTPQSTELVIYLGSVLTLAAVANGGPDAEFFASAFDHQLSPSSPCPRFLHIRRLLHQMHADQPRAYHLWKEAAPTAVDATMKLVARCPELKRSMQLPRHNLMPCDLTPLIGARRSHKRRRSSTPDRTPADVLSRAFLRQKRMHLIQDTDAYSEDPSNESTSNLALNTETGQFNQKPNSFGAVHNNASSSSVALNTKTEQIAPGSIIPGEQPMENAETTLEKQDATEL